MKSLGIEVIKGIDKLDNNTLEQVKGGLSEAEEEANCHLQFSCNTYIRKKVESKSSGALTLSVY